MRREIKKWCPMTDSNRRPTIYETVALPTELMGHNARFSGLGVRFQELFCGV